MTLVKNELPSATYLHEVFENRPDGTLWWKRRPPHHFVGVREWKIFNTKHAGKLAGRISGGYRDVCVCGIRYGAHRVIAVMCGMQIDGMVIDHINGDPLDNRRENLRACTQRDNARNCRNASGSKSAYPGVYWSKRDKRWFATIGVNGKRVYIAQRASLEEVIELRKVAERRYFGEFAPCMGVMAA